METVIVIESGEFEPQTLAGFCMAHHSPCANLSLAHEKVKLDGSAQVFPNGSLDEDAAQIEVPNVREFPSTIAMPINVNAIVCVNTRTHPSEIASSFCQDFPLQRLLAIPRSDRNIGLGQKVCQRAETLKCDQVKSACAASPVDDLRTRAATRDLRVAVSASPEPEVPLS